MQLSRRALLSSLILGILALAGSAQATTIIYQFIGEIDEVNGSAPFVEDQIVTGTFTWSEVLGVKSSSATQAVYDGMGLLSFTVEGFGPSGPIDELVIDNNNPLLGDAFRLRSSAFLDTSELRLEDDDETVFTSLMIPLMLDLADFNDAEFTLDLPGSGSIEGQINELILVPEPASAALLVLGLLGLTVASRRP